MAYDPTAAAGAAPSWTVPEKFLSWDVDHTRFEMKRVLGKGSYGSVAEALDHATDPPRRVAIKRIPNVFDVFENAKRIYREISILRVLAHPNITGILHLERPPDIATFKDLYIVMEALDTDMAKLIRDETQNLTVPHVRWFLYQMLLGLKFVHSANIIHRDLKPANILLTEACDLKICDFGLARALETAIDEDAAESTAGVSGVPPPEGESSSSSGTTAGQSSSSSSASATAAAPGAPPAIARQMTKHVVTRWYRAPELPLYNDGRYSVAIDIWSIGCIMAEMLSMLDSGMPGHEKKRRALFPGGSCYPLSRGSKRSELARNKKDQLQVIFSVMGTPTEDEISRLRTADAREALSRVPPQEPISLAEKFPTAGAEAVDLLTRFLRFIPEDRCTVDEALAHPFLVPVRRPEDEVTAPVRIEFPEVNRSNIRDLIVSEIAHYNPDIPADWRARGVR